ncbi:MAG: hypothetical protein LBH59_00195 [Planctomycetaceae bacterium]|nr:hypothetical protein [Planctomycetaceae bacterium]
MKHSYPNFMRTLKNYLTYNDTDHLLQAIDCYFQTYRETDNLDKARNAFFKELKKNDKSLTEVSNTASPVINEFVNDSDPDVSNVAKQLRDPAKTITIDPFTIEVYDDQKRFTIRHEKHLYNLVSELYYFLPDNKRVIARSYFFRENDIDLYLTITRDIETNNLIEIMYSFGNGDKIYIDQNGDGTWDIIKNKTATK